MITPLQGNILIEPVVEQTAFSTSQAQYEERGKVIAIANSILNLSAIPLINVGDIIYFDSWQVARFKDGEGKDVWLVHIDAVRAVEKVVEKNEPPLPE